MNRMRRGRCAMVAAVSALVVAACGGSSVGSNGGAAGSGGAGAGSGATATDTAGNAGSGGAAGRILPTTRNVFVQALADPPCMPRALVVDTSGQTTCFIVETEGAGSCDCTAPGRSPVDATVLEAVQTECGSSSPQATCTAICACRISQESGPALAACKADPTAASRDPSIPAGFCYIDDPASPSLSVCMPSEKRMIGFVSPSTAPTPTPTPGAALFLACKG